jgi:4-diphosphocytidyl-2-C-methyl-D-erythritol kinase
MVSFPHCKINLGLNVVSKRADGFHNIETCFYPVPRTDNLEIIPASEFSFTQSGLNVQGLQDDNLCMKAYHLLRKDFGMGNIKMHLHKVIPMGAGLGGGSSDGAFALRLLNSIFDLKISVEQLKNYAAQLGSDCSFFIEEGPRIGTGRGEIVKPASIHLSGHYLVLIKPDINVSTVEAYAGINPQKTESPIGQILELPLEEWKNTLKNDFEESIFKKYPLIRQLKEKMYSHGAVYASMSGSGSSVFGIFKKPVELKKDFSGLDYWSGELK